MSDSTPFDRTWDAPRRACATAAELLGSTLLRAGAGPGGSPALGRPVDRADAIASAALHLCVRLLELDRLDESAPLGTWSDVAERSAQFERSVCREDEPGLRIAPMRELSDDCLRQSLALLRSAARELERTGNADPIGTLYESVLGLVPRIEPGGRLHLRPAAGSRRKIAGAFYTPTELIDHLVRCTLDPLLNDHAVPAAGLRICDPSAGSGRFLVAAAGYLAQRQAAASRAGGAAAGPLTGIVQGLYAVDRDPVAIELTRFRLWESTGFASGVLDALRRTCRVGDALIGSPVDASLDAEAADRWCGAAAGGQTRRWFHWQHAFAEVFPPGGDGAQHGEGFDAVVGNPPFLSRLASATAMDDRDAAIVRRWSAGTIRRYADASVAFLLRSMQLVRPGGRITLVQPLSFLASRDAQAARRSLATNASLAGMWLSTGPVFPGTDVLTCAPMLVTHPAVAGPVQRSEGNPPRWAQSLAVSGRDLRSRDTWSFIAADSLGIPAVDVQPSPTLSSIASATADFRDQYYGLDGFLVDRAAAADDAFPRLVTAGLIDPADCRWGHTPTRVHKRRWSTPRIDRQRMDAQGTLGPWIDSRLVPKLLVATQTRVIEAIADEGGRLVPSTPVLTVVPHRAEDLWRLGAALTSPVCSAIGLRDFSGAALTGDTIKLAARQLLGLPLPTDADAWETAAAEFRSASHAASPADRRRHLHASARASLAAYRVAPDHGDALLRWWSARLPDRAKVG